MFAAILHVMRFELQRSFAIARVATWVLLWAFPTVLIATAVLTTRVNPPIVVASLLSFILVPQVSCMLGLLLWATPSIQSELEGKTWIYISLRPHGKLAVLIGKYCLAVLWSGSACLISSWVIAWLLGHDQWFQLAVALSGLSMLACMSYGALYSLIGVLVTKRAMIAALAYSLLVEVAISWVPATINQLTVSYRLRSLLSQWMELDRLRSRTELFNGTESTMTNVSILVCYSLGLLSIASFALLRREQGPESDS